MIRRDYLMKMIEEAAQVIARALRLVEDGSYMRSLEVIDESFVGLLDDSWENVRERSLADFAEKIHADNNWELPQVEVLADLLRTRGEVLLGMGLGEDARDCLLKSQASYRYLNQQEPDLFSIERMHHLDRISELLERF